MHSTASRFAASSPAAMVAAVLVTAAGPARSAIASESLPVDSTGSRSMSADPATSAIRFYQSYLSSLRHGRCRFTPSCSQYAIECIRAYGIVAGSARAADRLMRCNAGASRFYARDSEGRLIDPARGDAPDRTALIVPSWLLSPEQATRWAAAESLRTLASHPVETAQ